MGANGMENDAREKGYDIFHLKKYISKKVKIMGGLNCIYWCFMR